MAGSLAVIHYTLERVFQGTMNPLTTVLQYYLQGRLAVVYRSSPSWPASRSPACTSCRRAPSSETLERLNLCNLFNFLLNLCAALYEAGRTKQPPGRARDVALARNWGRDHVRRGDGEPHVDAGRLRVSFGSKPRLSAEPSAWPVVEAPPPPPCQKEAVLEMQGAQPRVEPEGLQGRAVAGGCVVFGMGTALTNRLSLSYGSQVCSAPAPLPMAWLLAQALSAVGLDRRPLCAGGLVLAAGASRWCARAGP